MATYEAVLDALGDRTRRQIIQCLRASPAAVGELAVQLPVSRPAISQHLRILRDSDLVTFETWGTRNITAWTRPAWSRSAAGSTTSGRRCSRVSAARAEDVAVAITPNTEKRPNHG